MLSIAHSRFRVSRSDFGGEVEKTKMSSKPSLKIRVVAKIRGHADRETKRWISVHKPSGEDSETVALSFDAQSASKKESHQVHYCYEPNEDNDKIYIREIKPFISEVFDGHNFTTIAYGARGSGKTCLIQGSGESPGLTALAIEDITEKAERLERLVTISFYEIYQEQVYDLLKSERAAVSILEDAQGKIKLKGLSQVPIKTGAEFRKLYFGGCNSNRTLNKTAYELPKRSHRGLIIHVTSLVENTDAPLVGKLNFVDLTGYEDPRRKSNDGLSFVEKSKINKSLYALQNVLHALNANENHVPFRESKVTRLLQDSLGGLNNRLTVIACLNPLFCQDSIYITSLASRICQGSHQIAMESAKKGKTFEKPVVISSSKVRISQSASGKQIRSRVGLLRKNASCKSIMKGKKLFGETNDMNNDVKASSNTAVASTVEAGAQEEETSVSADASSFESLMHGDEKSGFSVTKSMVSSEKQISSTVLQHTLENTEPQNGDVSHHCEENQEEVSSNLSCREEALPLPNRGSMGKENWKFFVNEGGSPPLTARLQELSNSLKLLYSSTPCVKMPNENVEALEPKTPIIDSNVQGNEGKNIANTNSPWAASRTCYPATKNSLIQEYLRIFNSASKEELKGLRGIGEKRATSILQLREKSLEPFKSLDDLGSVGLSAKQVKKMLAIK
ncbi:kinesin-like protein KIN-10C isoform X2 [Rhodamnia argentea]|uniref:Kinesin-like protein KIN-10C isoform X2 n=1 Tax=Rhodamnia argentea TaxID=178133 RepID=A0A8B8PQH2_9MYRT|nr:kinesin-like protein KIN-10C isoform X2 [Rhodamnia argentea]